MIMEEIRKETIEVSLEDVFRISCGVDPEGNALAASMLAIDQPNGDELDTIDNVFLENAVLEIKSGGGCAAVSLDFPLTSRPYFQKAKQMCEDWISGEKENGEILSLLVSPFLLNGCVYILLRNLVFAYGHVKEDGGSCLILVFDHTATDVFETEDVDYGLIVREVEAELKRREEELYEELDEAKEEERKSRAEEYTGFTSDFSDIPESGRKQDLVSGGKVRAGKRYRGIRFAKREDEDNA